MTKKRGEKVCLTQTTGETEQKRGSTVENSATSWFKGKKNGKGKLREQKGVGPGVEIDCGDRKRKKRSGPIKVSR